MKFFTLLNLFIASIAIVSAAPVAQELDSESSSSSVQTVTFLRDTFKAKRSYGADPVEPTPTTVYSSSTSELVDPASTSLSFLQNTFRRKRVAQLDSDPVPATTVEPTQTLTFLRDTFRARRDVTDGSDDTLPLPTKAPVPLPDTFRVKRGAEAISADLPLSGAQRVKPLPDTFRAKRAPGPGPKVPLPDTF